MREDRYTNTPADAAAFERAHGLPDDGYDRPSMADVVGNDSRGPFPIGSYVQTVLNEHATHLLDGGRRTVSENRSPAGDYASLPLLPGDDRDALLALMPRWLLEGRIDADTMFVRRAPALAAAPQRSTP